MYIWLTQEVDVNTDSRIQIIENFCNNVAPDTTNVKVIKIIFFLISY